VKTHLTLKQEWGIPVMGSRHKPSCGPPAMSPTQTQRSVLFTHTAWRQKDKTAYSCDNSDTMLVALVHPHYTVLRCH